MKMNRTGLACLMVAMIISMMLIVSGCPTEDTGDTTYTISVTQTTGGTITVNPAEAVAGTMVTVTISANSGYQLKTLSAQADVATVTVSVSGGGTSYTFPMPAANVRISGVFEAISLTKYAVSVTPGIANGSITAAPVSAEAGTTVVLTISPASGYQLKAGSISAKAGGTAIPVTNNTFVMPAADVTVNGEFEAVTLESYNVSVTSGIAHGSITAAPVSATKGTTITLTISPESGYRLKAGSLSVKAGGTAITVTNDTFAMPDADVTVNGEFEVIPPSYTISIESGILNGSITVPANAEVGATITLTISPASGYRLKADSLSVKKTDGTAITLTNNTFTMPAVDVTVSGEFELIPPIYAVNITQSPGGVISANPASAEAGTIITLTINPATGYRLQADSLSVKRTDTNADVSISDTDNTFTMPASGVSVEGVFEGIPNTIVIDFESIDEENIDSDNSGTNSLSINASPADSFEVSVTGVYDSFQWYVDEISYGYGTNSFTVYSYDFNIIGPHTITVIVEKDGAYYSKELSFEVTW